MPSGAFCAADNRDEASRKKRANTFIEISFGATRMIIHGNIIQSHWRFAATRVRHRVSSVRSAATPDLLSTLMKTFARFLAVSCLASAISFGMIVALHAQSSDEKE